MAYHVAEMFFVFICRENDEPLSLHGMVSFFGSYGLLNRLTTTSVKTSEDNEGRPILTGNYFGFLKSRPPPTATASAIHGQFSDIQVVHSVFFVLYLCNFCHYAKFFLKLEARNTYYPCFLHFEYDWFFYLFFWFAQNLIDDFMCIHNADVDFIVQNWSLFGG